MSAAGGAALPAPLTTYVLVFARCAAMYTTFPVFSARQVPNQVKLALSLLTAFLIAGSLPASPEPADVAGLALAVASQVAAGLAMGLAGTFLFAGLQFAGEIVDTQAGFAVTNIINPTTNSSVTILNQLQLILATLIFLAVDAHHLLLRGMAGSFALLPLPYADPQPALMADLGAFFAQAMDIVFKIAVPTATALLVTNVAMGLLARVAPQVNVFVVAFPAQLGIGMLVFAASLPLLAYVLPTAYGRLPAQMDLTLRHLSRPR